MSQEPGPQGGGTPSTRGRILVIDDSELVLEITRDALEEAGYEVVTNSSWVEVNATIRGRRPDMILLDLMMPSIKGESLCEILKKSSFGRDMPIIIFSTKDEAEMQRLVEEAGADGYIVKRMNRKDIVDSVDHYFEKLVRPRGGSGAPGSGDSGAPGSGDTGAPGSGDAGSPTPGVGA